MKHRIIKARVTRIALVPKGANRLGVLYKEDKSAEFTAMTKAAGNFDELGELLAVVYAPDVVDADNDFAPADVVRDMAHTFAKEMGKVDLRHSDEALGRDRAYVAESFIIQKGDSRFADWQDYDGKSVDVTGGWGVLLKIDDEKLRKLYREGKWNGVSFGAPECELELVKADLPKTKAAAYGKPPKKSIKKAIKHVMHAMMRVGEMNMDARLLKKALKKAFRKAFEADGESGGEADQDQVIKTVVKTITKQFEGSETPAATPAPAPAPAPAPKTPEIDLTNSSAVRAHLVAMKKAKLAKAVDLADPDAVEKHLMALEKAETEAKAGVKETSDEKLARLERENTDLSFKLKKSQGSSTQSDSEVASAPSMQKELVDSIGCGNRIAQAAGRIRGYKVESGNHTK